jgi:hypothetical protein
MKFFLSFCVLDRECTVELRGYLDGGYVCLHVEFTSHKTILAGTAISRSTRQYCYCKHPEGIKYFE